MSTDRLALLGGEPAFRQPLHVGRPNVGETSEVLQAVGEILERKWFTNDGPTVRAFEAAICAHLGVRQCVTVCNATVALELAIRALGLTGEVIVPSYTFIATAHALQWQGITPVFCDIDSAHSIDPEAVQRLVTPRTTGILAVHLWGRPCRVAALQTVAEQHGLTLLFDAAHAFGCTYQGEPIGHFGRCEVFSFHATKFLNSFEGGAIVTNDDGLAEKLRLMRNFGFAGYDRVIYIGTNGKMTEVCAAMGLTNLRSIERLIAVNRRNYQTYREHLPRLPGVSLLEFDEVEQNNFQYVVVELDEESAGLTRDQLLAVLHSENVLARRYFWPGCHRMEPYRSYFPNAGLLLPNTERIAERVLVLPTGTAIEPSMVETICGVVTTAIAQAGRVAAALGDDPLASLVAIPSAG